MPTGYSEKSLANIEKRISLQEEYIEKLKKFSTNNIDTFKEALKSVLDTTIEVNEGIIYQTLVQDTENVDVDFAKVKFHAGVIQHAKEMKMYLERVEDCIQSATARLTLLKQTREKIKQGLD